MKKIYQIPETDVVRLHCGPFLEDDNTSGIGVVINANEKNNFDEGELSTETSNSSLWED